METVEIKIKLPDSWPRFKRLINPETNQTYVPSLKDGVSHYLLPLDYAENLLAGSPELFERVSKGKGKSEEAGVNLKLINISRLTYKKKQMLYSKVTGKKSIGMSDEELTDKLQDIQLKESDDVKTSKKA